MNMRKRIEKLDELVAQKLGLNALKLYAMEDGETEQEAIARLGLAEAPHERFLLLTEVDTRI